MFLSTQFLAGCGYSMYYSRFACHFGRILLIVVNVNKIIANVESSVEIAAFLLDGADVADIGDRIIRLEGVEEVRFVSRMKALSNSASHWEMKNCWLAWRGCQPLPDVFRIKAVSADIVPQLAEEIGAIEGVEFADYGRTGFAASQFNRLA